ncbi:MAG: peptidylprolyl isomerase [Tannerella sp.]|jgi:peptidyl-prolyl cis-trans isomerase SurA|nr:peptidylprolyl isomerase [Tannerella sp.]
MKKVFVLLLGLNICFTFAQQKEDPVIMTVADMEIPLSEFLFLAKKDSEVNLLNKKSLENDVELFKNFKLKVADAKSLRIDESMGFQTELTSYQAQLIENYLVDREGEEQVVRKIYEMGKESLSLNHIVFLLPEKSLPKDTLEVFLKANEIYKRIKAGEDLMTVGKSLEEVEGSRVFCEQVPYVIPLQTFKELIDVVYAMSPGEISPPARSPLGFHIIQLNRKVADSERIQVAQILIQSPEPEGQENDEAMLKTANEAYERIKNGEDFAELAKYYSFDENTKYNGGVLPPFGMGAMVLPVEQAAFALENIGDVSKPVRTRVGYHIIKLIEKKGYPTFEEMQQSLLMTMQQGDWNHELRKVFMERRKVKMGYALNQEAFDEMLKLCDDYFPTDTAFYNRATVMEKTLMHINGSPHPQYEFADYIRLKPQSQKTYSGDYFKEQYALFVGEIISELVKKSLENDPEFLSLIKEYHDGILLFEVSDTKVWSKPVEEQENLEREWMTELNKKYKVTINRKVLNNLKKYLN